MENKKKALFFLPPGVGGSERITITIAKMLPRDEFEVKFIIVGKSKGDIAHFIPEGYGCELLHVNTIWEFVSFRMARIMKREKALFVFSSLRYLNFRVITAAKMVGGIKVIVRNDNTLEGMRWDKFMLMKLTYPYADVIITQQEEMREQLLKKMMFSSQKVVTLQNPIDITTIDEKIEEPNPYPVNLQINYVWVARFGEDKGQDFLVRAFKIVHDMNSDTHLYLVGKYNPESEYYIQIYNYIEENNLKDYVHVTGFDDNPYKWMKHANCFVLPSRREGLPNALIEAMYVGIPVVATRCVPIVDRIVKDGYNGYVVNVDDEKNMARRMGDSLLLKNFTMTYKPASKMDFIALFNTSKEDERM